MNPVMGKTDQLIRRLSAELTPVEILPTLTRTATLVVALAVTVAAASYLLGVSLGVYGGAPSRPGAWLSVAGHGVLGLGALAAAIAACVPDRIGLERAGGWISAVGLAGMAALIGGMAAASPVRATSGLTQALACLSLSLLPALVPGYFVIRFISRGVPRRPRWSALLGVVAVTALVALPGHLVCRIADPLHIVFAHLLAPLIAGLLAIAWVPGMLGREAADRAPSSTGGA